MERKIQAERVPLSLDSEVGTQISQMRRGFGRGMLATFRRDDSRFPLYPPRRSAFLALAGRPAEAERREGTGAQTLSSLYRSHRGTDSLCSQRCSIRLSGESEPVLLRLLAEEVSTSTCEPLATERPDLSSNR